MLQDRAVLCDLERIAEQSRPAELFHHRLSELFECIADDDHLSDASQFIQEFLCARDRVHLTDSFLYFLDSQVVLSEDVESVLHELVIIRLVTSRSLQLLDARCLGECDPDLRDKYAFHV